MSKDLYKEIYKLQPIEFLEKIKDSNLRFLKDFWINKEGKNYSIKLIKYLYEDMLEFSDEDIINNTKFSFFKNYGLDGMIRYGYNNSIYNVINTVYPNKFKIWEISVLPKHYWTNDRGIEATKWLIEEKLDYFNKEKTIKPTALLFTKYKLGGMLQLLYSNSPYKAINSAYPYLRPWEVAKVPKNFWTLENGIKATKWLIEDKLNYFENKEVKISKKVFRDYKLLGMLNLLFRGSTFEAINAAYPGKFKPWELCTVPNKYWTLDTAIDATKWLIEEKLKWNNEQIRKNIRKDTFFKYGLAGMLAKIFNYSPYIAISTTYPGKFKKEDFNTKH